MIETQQPSHACGDVVSAFQECQVESFTKEKQESSSRFDLGNEYFSHSLMPTSSGSLSSGSVISSKGSGSTLSSSPARPPTPSFGPQATLVQLESFPINDEADLSLPFPPTSEISNSARSSPKTRSSSPPQTKDTASKAPKKTLTNPFVNTPTSQRPPAITPLEIPNEGALPSRAASFESMDSLTFPQTPSPVATLDAKAFASSDSGSMEGSPTHTLHRQAAHSSAANSDHSNKDHHSASPSVSPASFTLAQLAERVLNESRMAISDDGSRRPLDSNESAPRAQSAPASRASSPLNSGAHKPALISSANPRDRSIPKSVSFASPTYADSRPRRSSLPLLPLSNLAPATRVSSHRNQGSDTTGSSSRIPAFSAPISRDPSPQAQKTAAMSRLPSPVARLPTARLPSPRPTPPAPKQVTSRASVGFTPATSKPISCASPRVNGAPRTGRSSTPTPGASGPTARSESPSSRKPFIPSGTAFGSSARRPWVPSHPPVPTSGRSGSGRATTVRGAGSFDSAPRFLPRSSSSVDSAPRFIPRSSSPSVDSFPKFAPKSMSASTDSAPKFAPKRMAHPADTCRSPSAPKIIPKRFSGSFDSAPKFLPKTIQRSDSAPRSTPPRNGGIGANASRGPGIQPSSRCASPPTSPLPINRSTAAARLIDFQNQAPASLPITAQAELPLVQSPAQAPIAVDRPVSSPAPISEISEPLSATDTGFLPGSLVDPSSSPTAPFRLHLDNMSLPNLPPIKTRSVPMDADNTDNITPLTSSPASSLSITPLSLGSPSPRPAWFVASPTSKEMTWSVEMSPDDVDDGPHTVVSFTMPPQEDDDAATAANSAISTAVSAADKAWTADFADEIPFTVDQEVDHQNAEDAVMVLPPEGPPAEVNADNADNADSISPPTSDPSQQPPPSLQSQGVGSISRPFYTHNSIPVSWTSCSLNTLTHTLNTKETNIPTNLSSIWSAGDPSAHRCTTPTFPSPSKAAPWGQISPFRTGDRGELRTGGSAAFAFMSPNSKKHVLDKMAEDAAGNQVDDAALHSIDMMMLGGNQVDDAALRSIDTMMLPGNQVDDEEGEGEASLKSLEMMAQGGQTPAAQPPHHSPPQQSGPSGLQGLLMSTEAASQLASQTMLRSGNGLDNMSNLTLEELPGRRDRREQQQLAAYSAMNGIGRHGRVNEMTLARARAEVVSLNRAGGPVPLRAEALALHSYLTTGSVLSIVSSVATAGTLGSLNTNLDTNVTANSEQTTTSSAATAQSHGTTDTYRSMRSRATTDALWTADSRMSTVNSVTSEFHSPLGKLMTGSSGGSRSERGSVSHGDKESARDLHAVLVTAADSESSSDSGDGIVEMARQYSVITDSSPAPDTTRPTTLTSNEPHTEGAAPNPDEDSHDAFNPVFPALISAESHAPSRHESHDPAIPPLNVDAMDLSLPVDMAPSSALQPQDSQGSQGSGSQMSPPTSNTRSSAAAFAIANFSAMGSSPCSNPRWGGAGRTDKSRENGSTERTSWGTGVSSPPHIMSPANGPVSDVSSLPAWAAAVIGSAGQGAGQGSAPMSRVPSLAHLISPDKSRVPSPTNSASSASSPPTPDFPAAAIHTRSPRDNARDFPTSPTNLQAPMSPLSAFSSCPPSPGFSTSPFNAHGDDSPSSSPTAQEASAPDFQTSGFNVQIARRSSPSFSSTANAMGRSAFSRASTPDFMTSGFNVQDTEMSSLNATPNASPRSPRKDTNAPPTPSPTPSPAQNGGSRSAPSSSPSPHSPQPPSNKSTPTRPLPDPSQSPSRAQYMSPSRSPAGSDLAMLADSPSFTINDTVSPSPPSFSRNPPPRQQLTTGRVSANGMQHPQLPPLFISQSSFPPPALNDRAPFPFSRNLSNNSEITPAPTSDSSIYSIATTIMTTVIPDSPLSAINVTNASPRPHPTTITPTPNKSQTSFKSLGISKKPPPPAGPSSASLLLALDVAKQRARSATQATRQAKAVEVDTPQRSLSMSMGISEQDRANLRNWTKEKGMESIVNNGYQPQKSGWARMVWDRQLMVSPRTRTKLDTKLSTVTSAHSMESNLSRPLVKEPMKPVPSAPSASSSARSARSAAAAKAAAAAAASPELQLQQLRDGSGSFSVGSFSLALQQRHAKAAAAAAAAAAVAAVRESDEHHTARPQVAGAGTAPRLYSPATAAAAAAAAPQMAKTEAWVASTKPKKSSKGFLSFFTCCFSPNSATETPR